MSRYIDADKLEYITWSLYNGHDMRGNTLFIEREIVSKQIVDAMPTADVVEVRHGEWLMPLTDEPWRKGYFCRCSVCNKTNNGHTLSIPSFCENCGAKMDGEGRGNDE